MSLLHKPDWEETKQRYLSWWHGEYFGRCGLSVIAPKESKHRVPPPTAPDDPVARWTDLSYIAAANEWEHAHHFFGGEAFPGWHGGYPGHTSVWAFLGCPITLDACDGVGVAGIERRRLGHHHACGFRRKAVGGNSPWSY